MLYYLYHLREHFTAFNVFQYPEFRAAFAAISAFLAAVLFGGWFICFLRRRQVLERAEKGDSERLRDLHKHKSETPTMGGVILLFAVLVATLLWARPERMVLLLVGMTLAFGTVGFFDDVIKLRSQRKGLPASTKLLCQVILAALAGWYLYSYPLDVTLPPGVKYSLLADDESAATTLFFPFFKTLCVPLGLAYVLLVVLVTTSTSNAVNLTDGLDGLAIGCSVLVGITFVMVAFLTGYKDSSEYLLIPHVTGGLEVAVFAAALVGAGMGFLWFNCHPAQIFMGDTGALALGGSLGLIAILCKQEILLVFVGGVLVVEALSVILQVASFKLMRKRIFLIAPLHHHYQFKGWAETQVTVRFWIVGAILALFTLVTLKIR